MKFFIVGSIIIILSNNFFSKQLACLKKILKFIYIYDVCMYTQDLSSYRVYRFIFILDEKDAIISVTAISKVTSCERLRKSE